MLPISRSIDDLDFETQRKYLLFTAKMKEAGIKYTVTRTASTYAVQEALFAQGRKDLALVNQLRSVVGLAPLTAEQNKRPVTWTLNSHHIVRSPQDKASAFDIAILDNLDKITWDIKADVNQNEIPDYEEAARIGESVGLKAGARFSTPDYPHFENKEG